MPFPGIIRRLFENDGAGPLLRKDIIPPHSDTHDAGGSDPIEASGADAAARLETPRAVLVNLESTDPASFDGTADIAPGVSGILPTSGGGTGRDDGRAVALAEARTIRLTGDVTGSVSFDGSEDVTLNAVVAGAGGSIPGGGGSIPVGGIIAFSGTFGGEDSRHPIPPGGDAPDEGWILCDGITTNGVKVPDLRGRMLIGVSASYPLDKTGGAETHTHTLSATAASAGSHSHGDTFSVASGGAHTHTVSGSVGATTLSTSTIPSHSHSMGLYTNVNVTTYNGPQGGLTKNNYTGTTNAAGGSGSHTHSLSSAKTASAGGHSHTISGSVSSGGAHTHSVSGSAAAASNLPPYYALAFIMRIA